MKQKYFTMIIEQLCEKVEQLQSEKFTLEMENSLLKNENEALKARLHEASSNQKQN